MRPRLNKLFRKGFFRLTSLRHFRLLNPVELVLLYAQFPSLTLPGIVISPLIADLCLRAFPL